MFHERDLGLWVFSFNESTEISARFYRKFLRKDFFTNITFRKNVHADFYGFSDIDSVVTDFDRNSSCGSDHLPYWQLNSFFLVHR